MSIENHGERIARLETRAESMERVLGEINESLKKLTENVTRMDAIHATLSRHEKTMSALDDEIHELDQKLSRKTGDIFARIDGVEKRSVQTDEFVRSRWWALVAIVSSTIVLVEAVIKMIQ